MNQQTEILELDITQDIIDTAIENMKTCNRPSQFCVVSEAARHANVEGFHRSAAGKLIDSYHNTIWGGGEEAAEVMANFDSNFFKDKKVVKKTIKPTKLIFTKVG